MGDAGKELRNSGDRGAGGGGRGDVDRIAVSVVGATDCDHSGTEELNGRDISRVLLRYVR